MLQIRLPNTSEIVQQLLFSIDFLVFSLSSSATRASKSCAFKESNLLSASIVALYTIHSKDTQCSLDNTPYHPQTDGLVERFNQTLKAMLRKSATEDGKDWDKLIPYLLFAYREVPQASTGFSPFELVYGGLRIIILSKQ